MAALKAATKPLENDVKFGMLLFPDSKANGCAVPSKPEVPMMLGASGKIGQALDSNPPGGFANLVVHPHGGGPQIRSQSVQ